MKYLALTLIALTSIFAAPTVASATEIPAQGNLPASSPDSMCDNKVAKLLPWCWKA